MSKYKRVYCPDHPGASKEGRVYEHRLIMEKKLGRYLEPNEEVHHIDHNPRNNDPDNLMLFTNHSEHTRHEMIGNNRNPKINMDNRICSNCNSNETYIKPTGRPHWYKDKNENLLCKNCWNKIYFKLKRQILSPKR